MQDLPLIKKVAQTKKPIIISTGMAKLNEIETVYNFAKEMEQKKSPYYIVLAIIHQRFRTLI